MDRNTTTQPHISVIIPVYNEMETINELISSIREVGKGHHVEIIVSDGGPGHATLKAIESDHIIKVESPPGRGRQLNAGATMACGELFLFLHADTVLPANGFTALEAALSTHDAGSFSLVIDSDRPAFRIISFFANLRTRTERVPYGDQAQFIRAEHFRALGGFAEIPIMEDVEFFKRVRMEGLSIVILGDKVKTSARRWDKEGIIRRTLTNWWLRLRYAFGASPNSLIKHYQPPESKADE